jgi:hypothetical protein
MLLITGEKFKQLSRVNIVDNDSYQTKINGDKVLDYQDFTSSGISTLTQNLYMCTHLIDKPDIIEKLNFIDKPFNLILHNSDTHFKKENLKLLDDVPNLKKIFTQNCEVDHPLVIPIPIGLAVSKWDYGDLKIFTSVMNQDIPKNKLVYFNFSIETNEKERGECYQKLMNKGLKWSERIDYYSYLKYLKGHKFAISPPGNGVDCYRIWECLYFKIVPICKKSFLTDYFSKMFPIIVLEDWDDLEIESLNYDDYSWENYHMLDFDYWERTINRG